MTWIDFKSGFALVGSLVVLAGSLDSRMRERKEKPKEKPKEPGGVDGGPVVPKEPVRPEPMNPDEFRSGTKREFEPLEQIELEKRAPPTTSA